MRSSDISRSRGHVGSACSLIVTPAVVVAAHRRARRAVDLLAERLAGPKLVDVDDLGFSFGLD